MKVKTLILELLECDMNAQVVVQKNHGDGYFSLHNIGVQPRGHIGYAGPIIHIGEQQQNNSEKSPTPEGEKEGE